MKNQNRAIAQEMQFKKVDSFVRNKKAQNFLRFNSFVGFLRCPYTGSIRALTV